MPTYRVTDPDTGRVFDLTGDSQPTEKELEQIFSAQPAVTEPEVQTPTIANPVAAEAAGAINRGVAAIPDFVIDAANTLIEFTNRSGLPEVASLGGATELPKIPRVQDTLEDVTDGAFGARNFMEPGLARTVVQEGGEVAGGFATAGVAPARTAARVTQQLADDAAAQSAQIAGRLRIGDKRAATQAISEAGEVITDPAAAAAIRQGFDDGVVSTIKAASDATKVRMRKMVAIAKRGINERVFANKNRPADEVGSAVAKRITRIANVNKQAGKSIDREAKKLAGQNVDLAGARRAFDDSLAEAGVGIDVKTVDLAGSAFEDVPNVEKILTIVKRRLDNLDEAQGAHRFKRWLDNQISGAKLSEGGLSGDAERLLLGVRRSVDDALDATFDSYRVANERFAETRQVLDSFQDAAGKINLDSPNVEKQIGTLSRRLLSNVQSRVRLLGSLEGLDEVAANHGVDVSDDVFALARFADELDRVFKPVARTSLNAEVAKAARSAVDQGPARAFVNQGLERGIERVTGINEAGALRAIEELLKP